MKVIITLQDKDKGLMTGCDIDVAFDPPVTIGEATGGALNESAAASLAAKFLKWIPTIGKTVGSRLVDPDGKTVADIDLETLAGKPSKSPTETSSGEGMENN